MTFIQLTRVYVKKGDKSAKINQQKITVAAASVATVRASNRLGYPEHRATITLTSGAEFDVADSYAAIRSMLGLRN